MSGSDGRPITIYADVVCDLFHYGHVEFFRQARALGDRLIVGLVSDGNVATYEPPPLHCTRAFLDEIGADYCCHGDDMSADQLAFWYGDLISSGRLKVVRYTPAISSRQIVARIADRLARQHDL